MKIQYNKSGNLVALLDHHYNGIAALKQDIAANLGLDSLDHDSFYSMWNGRILTDVRLRSIPASHDEPAVITIVPRVLGGMLQAVGTQSTTTQAEEEKEKVEAKKPKLDTVKPVEEDPPLPILDDQTKPEEKDDNDEVVAEAVDQEEARDSGNVEPPDIASQLTNSSSSCSSFTSDDSNPQTTTPTQVAGSSGNAAAGTIDATKNAVAAESSTSEDEPEYLLYSSSDYETDDGVRVKKARIEP
ncbi:unnamed protein product [Orchesella dallaii]|uniref:Ubiquitin-like domain-containing protein n=1 Tax=Orchesella dallaii TaxID=48710 RepID=A0ABP1PU94_9HEXA